MPRYFFNIYDGIKTNDTEGTLLSGISEARREAVKCAGQVIRTECDAILHEKDWRLEVSDGNGSIIFRVDLIFMELPTMLGRYGMPGIKI